MFAFVQELENNVNTIRKSFCSSAPVISVISKYNSWTFTSTKSEWVNVRFCCGGTNMVVVTSSILTNIEDIDWFYMGCTVGQDICELGHAAGGSRRSWFTTVSVGLLQSSLYHDYMWNNMNLNKCSDDTSRKLPLKTVKMKTIWGLLPPGPLTCVTTFILWSEQNTRNC